MFHPDLTKRVGTIGKVFTDNREALLFAKDVDTLRSLVDKLFSENNINTPKSRTIKYKLSSMKYTSAIMYVQNIIFSAMNMKAY